MMPGLLILPEPQKQSLRKRGAFQTPLPRVYPLGPNASPPWLPTVVEVPDVYFFRAELTDKACPT